MKTCDINKVPLVSELLAAPDPQRDAIWREKFYAAVVDASFACGDPQVFTGPDGFPYFALFSPEPYQTFDAYCLCNLVDHLVEHGLGAAINPKEQGVGWVFSGGDILALQMYGNFQVEDPALPESLSLTETIEAGERLLIGQPSNEVLPHSTRKNIRRFLADRIGLPNLKVYLMIRPDDQPQQQLVFSINRDDFPSDDDFKWVLQGISWYLPRHYVIAAMPSSGEAASWFEPL